MPNHKCENSQLVWKLISMILGMIISGFSCLLSKFLKSLGWRPKFKHHFLFRGHLTPKKSTLLISTNHHILKVKKKYQQCIQVYFSGASTWVSSNIKSRIEKVCPFSLFSLLFWWSPKREPQFGAGISWTPNACQTLCWPASRQPPAAALFSPHALGGYLLFTAGEAELPLTTVL